MLTIRRAKFFVVVPMWLLQSPAAYATDWTVPPDLQVEFSSLWALEPLSGDFDGDGRSEVVWFAEDDTWIVGADLLPSAISPALVPEGEKPSVVLDVDGDGFDDLVYSIDGALHAAMGSLHGLGLIEPIALPGVRRVFGDVDGDGATDVSHLQELWFGGVAPTSGPALPTEDPVVWPLGDLDGDGFEDVAVGEHEWVQDWGYVDPIGPLRIYRGGPAFDFDAPVASFEPLADGQAMGRAALTLADLDGDGDDDLLTVSAEHSSETLDDAALVWIDDPLGAATIVKTLPLPKWTRAWVQLLRAGDTDGDGADEVLWLENGSAIVLDPSVGAPELPVRMYAQVDEQGYQQFQVELIGLTVDLNGDGALDLVSTWDLPWVDGGAEAVFVVWLGPLVGGALPDPDPTDSGTVPVDPVEPEPEPEPEAPAGRSPGIACGCSAAPTAPWPPLLVLLALLLPWRRTNAPAAPLRHLVGSRRR